MEKQRKFTSKIDYNKAVDDGVMKIENLSSEIEKKASKLYSILNALKTTQPSSNQSYNSFIAEALKNTKALESTSKELQFSSKYFDEDGVYFPFLNKMVSTLESTVNSNSFKIAEDLINESSKSSSSNIISSLKKLVSQVKGVVKKIEKLPW